MACIFFRPCAVALISIICLSGNYDQAWAGAERENVGTVQRAENQAHATWRSDRRQMAIGGPVNFEDLLTTGVASRLLVTLLDETEVTLSERASLMVDKIVFDPENARVVRLKSLAGSFLLAVTQFALKGDNEVIMVTPSVTIGIRGTTVWGGQIDGGYGVFSLEGSVSVTTLAEVILLQEGEGVTVTNSAVPTPVLRWGEAKVARALATVAFGN